MLPSLHLGEINSSIHMYQFTFESLHFCFGVVVVSDGRSTDLAEKKHGSADLHPRIHPPLVNFPTKFGVKFTTSFPSSPFD